MRKNKGAPLQNQKGFNRQRFLYASIVFVGIFTILGCSPPRVQLKLPPPESSLEERVKAYKRYRAVSRTTTTVYSVSDGSTVPVRAYQRLDLNSGDLVYDPRDLSPMVPKGSETSESIKRYQQNASKNRWVMLSGFGVALIGGGLFVLATSQDGSTKEEKKSTATKVFGSPWFLGGVVMAGLGVSWLGYRIYGTKAVRHKRAAFYTYNQDLLAKLQLQKSSGVFISAGTGVSNQQYSQTKKPPVKKVNPQRRIQTSMKTPASEPLIIPAEMSGRGFGLGTTETLKKAMNPPNGISKCMRPLKQPPKAYTSKKCQEKDPKLCKLWQGCVQKQGKACHSLGIDYVMKAKKGWQGITEYFMRKSCALKFGEGCRHLSFICSHPLDPYGKKHYNLLGIRYNTKACQAGSGMGCYGAGRGHDAKRLSTRKDHKKAFHLYKKSCSLGYGPGCSSLGYKYISSWVVKTNYKKAFFYLRKGCHVLQDSGGCRILGNLYRTGTGVPKSCRMANLLNKKACKLGNFIACRSKCKSARK